MKNKHQKKNWPFYLRELTQYITFALFLCLLLFLDPLTEKDVTSNIFLRMSPLSASGTMIATKTFILKYWPAFLILLLTIPFGRFFCAWICPLGTTIDITDSFFEGMRKKAQKKFYDGRKFKYYVLAFLLICALFGLQGTGWFDPISIATNVYAISIHPYIVHILNGFMDYVTRIPFIGYLFSFIHKFFKDALFAYHEPFFKAHGILLFFFIFLISFGIVFRRYWCRNICPLGALLALFSDWSLYKRKVSSSCTSCGLCVTECGMGAIENDGHGTKDGECTLCMTCQKVCPENSVTFGRKRVPEQRVAINLSKRAFLFTGITGLVMTPFLKLNFSKYTNKGKTSLIRPPGAVNEEDFQALCVRCGECMKVCKTNGLHPVLLEAGIESVWTPKLIPRLGYCDYGCVLCTRVCPSGALQRLSLEEKRTVALGKARIDHNRCIPWVGYSRLPEIKKEWQDFNCGVCEEVCPIPTKAIHFNTFELEPGREIRRPFVREDVCIGCGFCEKVCPVLGTSAIVVEGIQPQTKIKSLKTPKSIHFFPETLGMWKRISGPHVYEGSRKLYEYINGGAEPYLSFSFKRVTSAEYEKAGENIILIDVWEFDTQEDAYGVFSREQSGKEVNLGNGSSLFDNYLYLWNGVYFVRIEPRQGDISADEVIEIGKGLNRLLPYKKPAFPEIMQSLPHQHLVPKSQIFFHKKIILDNIYITDNFIEENVFLLSEKTNAVIVEYKPETSTASILLLLIQYPDRDMAQLALKNMVTLWRTWGEKEFTTDNIHHFQDKDQRYTSCLQTKKILAATFFSHNRAFSEELLSRISEKLQ